jgi:hypothetical protein
MSKNDNAELREFVYLDEVSVFSLIASRLGAVAKEFTQTESSSLTAEVGGSAGVSAFPLKTDVSSRLEGTRSVEAQVVRKSIVQSTFKELLDYEREALALRPPSATDDVPGVGGPEDLDRLAKDAVSGWVVSGEALQRGQLFEVEVELDADEIFRLTTILSTVLEMMRENPELMPVNDQDGLRQAAALTRVLDKLLAGLIPIRGRATEYSHVTLGARDWLVSTRLLSRLPAGAVIQPLYVVGVTDASLFWKDIRRVLFTGARYSVMGRVGRSGIQATWTPIKLADVLKDVAPDLSHQFDGVREQFVSAFVAAADQTQASPGAQAAQDAVVDYCLAVATHHGQGYDESDVLDAGLHVVPDSAFETVDGQRAAFAKISAQLAEQFGVEIDDGVAREARRAAVLKYGLDPLRKLENGSAPEDVQASDVAQLTQGSYLDAEIVAVYW